ncbi:alpha/beta fold hydrolase [Amycolatopsis sp. NPDC059021]|uniref:alpha/beta fold hydrolase n=1 Tax=Amycolatopsis sp. NPDC059021 TaxID=3346704 RepID=UPI00366BE334
MTTPTVTTGTLRVPGARLHYELRGEGPLVVLVAAPMDARSFAPLADLLATDHTVLTTDPRGIFRSTVDDRDRDATPELRADDLSRLIAHVDAGPAAVLGSSGGAVTALALAQACPEQVRTVIAHEPPLLDLLDDREQQRAETEEIVETYLAGDHVEAMRKFLAAANIVMPEPVFQQVFGGERDAQQIADDDFQYRHMLRPTAYWQPDLAALRAAEPRIVVGIGEESGGQLCERTAKALAAELGIEPTMFPGDHIGFAGDPVAFEPRLRDVLRGN